MNRWRSRHTIERHPINRPRFSKSYCRFLKGWWPASLGSPIRGTTRLGLFRNRQRYDIVAHAAAVMVRQNLPQNIVLAAALRHGRVAFRVGRKPKLSTICPQARGLSKSVKSLLRVYGKIRQRFQSVVPSRCPRDSQRCPRDSRKCPCLSHSCPRDSHRSLAEGSYPQNGGNNAPAIPIGAPAIPCLSCFRNGPRGANRAGAGSAGA
jgi:hypothetical protein